MACRNVQRQHFIVVTSQLNSLDSSSHITPPTGDQDAGCGGGPVRHALDAVPHSGGCQLLPGPGLPGQLVPAFLPDLHLPQQRHQPGHLQRHVSEVSRRFPQDLPLRQERL